MKLIKGMCRSPLWCSIALVLLVASVWMSFAIDKHAVMSPFMESIGGPDSELGKQYIQRIQERRMLYIKGLGLGVILSLVYLSMKSSRSPALSSCIVAGITLLTAYMVYMLSPKSKLMVLKVHTQEQRMHWARIYKTMQWNYHVGLALGIVGVAVGGYVLC